MIGLLFGRSAVLPHYFIQPSLQSAMVHEIECILDVEADSCLKLAFLNRRCSECLKLPSHIDHRTTSSKPILIRTQSALCPEDLQFAMRSGWNKVWSPTGLSGFCSNTRLGYLPSGRKYSTLQGWVEDCVKYPWISSMYGGPHTVGYPIWPWYGLDLLPYQFLLLWTVVAHPQLPKLWPPVLAAKETANP